MGSIFFDGRTGKYYNLEEISVTTLRQPTEAVTSPIRTQEQPVQIVPTPGNTMQIVTQTTTPHVNTVHSRADQFQQSNIQSLQQPQQQTIEELMGEWLAPKSTVDVNHPAGATSMGFYGNGGNV